MADNNNVLGIESSINGQDIDKGSTAFIQAVTRMEKAADQLSASVDNFTKAIDGMNKSVDNTDKTTKRTTDTIRRVSQASSDARKNVSGMGLTFAELKQQIASSIPILGAYAAGMASIAGIKSFADSVVKVRAEFQAIEVGLKTLLQDEAKANDLLAKLKSYATISPLDFKGISAGAQMMISFGIEAEKVPKFISAIGDVSQGNSEKFRSLTLAFSQISAAGKLMGQDLLQLINAGFNPLQTMSEKTGKSIGDLKEEMSQGAISAEMVQQAFIDATSAGGKFYGMSENAAKTINGQFSMLQDAMDNMYNSIGKANEEVILKSISGVTALVKNYETIGRIITELIAVYGAYKAALIVATIAEKSAIMARVTHIKYIRICIALQNTFNKVAAMNPWALAAMAVAALGVSVYELVQHTETLKTAQEKLNEANAKKMELYEEMKRKANEAIQVVKDETNTDYERRKALEELQNLYPSTFRNLDMQAVKNMEVAEAMKQVNKEQEQQILLQKQKEIEDAKTKLPKAQALMSMAKTNSAVSYSDAKAKYTQLLAVIESNEKWIRDYWASAAKAADESRPIAEKLKSAEELRAEAQDNYDKAKKAIEEWKASHNSWEIDVPFTLIFDVKRSKKALDDAKEESEKLASLMNEGNLDTAYNKAKSEWIKAKEMVANIDAHRKDYSAEQRAQAMTELQKTKKMFETLGGNTSDRNSDKTDPAKQQRARLLLEQRQSEEVMTQHKALEFKMQQQEIDLLSEGYEKRKRQRELNKQRELEAIRQEEKQLLEAEINRRIAIEKAKNPKYDETTFDRSSVSLSETSAKYIESRKASVGLPDYKELISQYQDYADQRVEIEKKYNADILDLEEARKNATTQEQKDAITKAIASAQTKKGQELIKFDLDLLKQSPEYTRAFEDMKNTSTETLEYLINEFEKYKGEAAKSLEPSELKTYIDTIQQMYDEVSSRNPFKALSDALEDLNTKKAILDNAQNLLSRVQAGEKVVKNTTYDKDKRKIAKEYYTEADAIRDVNKATDDYIKAQNEVQKKQITLTKSFSEFGQSITNVGSAIGGVEGGILSMIGNIMTTVTTSIEGMKNVSTAASAAIQAVEKASVILAIISAAIQAMQALDKILPSADAKYEKYASKQNEINKLSDAVRDYENAVIKAKHAEDEWFGNDQLRNLKNFAAEGNKAMEDYYNKLYEKQAVYQNKSGRGWFTNSLSALNPMSWVDKWTGLELDVSNIGRKIFGDEVGSIIEGVTAVGSDFDKYSKGLVSAIDNLRIETRSAKKGLFGSGLGGRNQKTQDLREWVRENMNGVELFDENGLIDSELGETIIEKYGDKLQGQTKETLQALIEMRKEYDEYMESLKDYVNDMYSPLIDNLVDAVWTWYDEGTDALRSFQENATNTFRNIANDMIQELAMTMVFDNYKKKIQQLYEDYTNGKLTREQLVQGIASATSEMKDDTQEALPILQDFAQMIGDTMSELGYNIRNASGYIQSATTKESRTASQDSIDETNGRLTAMQVIGTQTLTSVEGIREMLTATTIDITSIRADIYSVKVGMDGIVEIQNKSLNTLTDISRNTHLLFDITDSMQRIQRKIETL